MSPWRRKANIRIERSMFSLGMSTPLLSAVETNITSIPTGFRRDGDISSALASQYPTTYTSTPAATMVS